MKKLLFALLVAVVLVAVVVFFLWYNGILQPITALLVIVPLFVFEFYLISKIEQ